MTILLNPACESCSCSALLMVIAGAFTTINGKAREHLAGLAASGSLTTLNLGLTTGVLGEVDCCAIDAVNRVLYLGGSVDTGLSLAAYDLDTGARITAWSPTIVGTVFDIDYYGGNLYIVGPSSINGTVVNNVARIAAYPSAATLDGGWAPGAFAGNVPFNINVGPNGTYVYIGGFFTSYAAHANSKGFVALLGTDASYVWSGNLRSGVGISGGYDVAFVDSIAYVCGLFTTAGPASVARNHCAAFDAATGAIQTWAPTVVPTAGFAVEVIKTTSRHAAVAGEPVWIGGSLVSVNGTPWLGIAKLATGALSTLDTSWDMALTVSSGTVSVATIGVFDGVVYAAGTFDFAQGVARINAVALSISGGAVANWYPFADGVILDMAFDSITA